MTLYVYAPNGDLQVTEQEFTNTCLDILEGSFILDTQFVNVFRHGIRITQQGTLWTPCNYDSFPNEFKTQLLLLGVL